MFVYECWHKTKDAKQFQFFYLIPLLMGLHLCTYSDQQLQIKWEMLAAEPSAAQPSSGTAHRSSADLQAAAQRRPPSEPQARNGGAQLEPQAGADQVKKKKKGRLTKAADMGGGVELMAVQEPSGTGMKRKMQVWPAKTCMPA